MNPETERRLLADAAVPVRQLPYFVLRDPRSPPGPEAHRRFAVIETAPDGGDWTWQDAPLTTSWRIPVRPRETMAVMLLGMAPDRLKRFIRWPTPGQWDDLREMAFLHAWSPCP